MLVIGIDEVGRGALAGPVVVAVAASVCSPRELRGLKDSKKLSARQREAWYANFVKNPKIAFAVARVYPRQIEKRNISAAANLAARRAFARLEKKTGRRAAGDRRPVRVFLDGGLYLGDKVWQAANVPTAKTMPKADEKIAAVSIASIIAKVTRDRFMRRLAKKYPAYGFDVHKGYGTAVHLAALAANGPCDVHRLTFLRKSTTM